MKFEIRKLLYNKILLAGCIISCMYMLYISYTFFYEGYHEEQAEGLDEQYYSCMGSYSQERLEYISKNYSDAMEYMKENPDDKNAFAVFQAYNSLCIKAERCAQIYSYRSNVVKNAKRLKQSSKPYISRVNEKIEKMYSVMPEIVISDGTKAKDLSDIFYGLENVDKINIILLIIASCTLFVIEHRKNTYSMIYSSLSGRGKTYFRKMMCMTIFAVFLSVMTTMCITLFSFTYGNISELFEPIQGLERFMYSPYDMNMAELLLAVTLMRALGYMALGTLFTVISIGFKSNIIPVVLSMLIGLLGQGMSLHYIGYVGRLVAITEYYDINIYMLVRKYTPFGFISEGEGYFTQYEPVNLFEYPVSVMTIGIIFNIMVISVVMVVGYQLYNKRYRKSGV